MQGQTFLGKEQAEPRQYVYGHRDRVDEASDLARSGGFSDGREIAVVDTRKDDVNGGILHLVEGEVNG